MADAPVQKSLSEAEQALSAFAAGPARDAAEAIAQAFENSAERIARAMVGATGDSENAVRRLAKTILEELARTALEDFPPGGGKESGGAFNGALQSAVNVHFHLGAGADAQAIARHQGQIAAQVARAVAYGGRNL